MGPLLFVAAALLALALVPVFVGRRTAGAETEIVEVLEPARATAADLALIQARQMSRFQAYLLTGDPDFRIRYRAVLAEEDEVYDDLLELADGMDLSVREAVAALQGVASRWHLAHQSALVSDEARRAYLEDLEAEQDRYDAVLAASREVAGRIAAEVADGRRTMEDARRLQIVLTVVLVAVALGAAVVLAVVARRLGALADAAEARRRDATRARRRADAILAATGDGVLSVDLEGRCTSMNRAGAALLGWGQHEAEGVSAHHLLHGREGVADHGPGACPLLAAVAEGREARRADARLVRRDGSAFEARWSLIPMRDGESSRGAVLTIADMTGVREAERGLRRAVAARDEVLAVVSHDLRNPVGTVGAAAELLLEMDLPEEKRREQLAIIRRTAGRMDRLIEDLLDVARIEGGALSLDREPVGPAELVREAAEGIGTLAREKGLALETCPGDHLPPLRVDRHRVLQALSNLLGNALKFTPAGGRITVGAREAAEGGAVELYVADTGEGIPHESRTRLFDRFWQQRRADRQGAGLGLAIVRGIAEAHGGDVRVESERGRGSTFGLVLPLDGGGGAEGA